ncbi:DUF2577 domain-containing protein [Paenibacillus xylanexedens]|uniref:DUF2577 domain-containing protein n=1 Tax=Paenibacillus xylanexedens TaxID=528191 RepID=UPI0021B5EF08|nr:DUF2577 domain-containing protein [Paenibacillus xylanexedens]
MAMIDVIKQIATQAVDAAGPVAIMYGTVSGTSPLEILVDQRFSLPKELLIVTETVSKYSLTSGDQVLLLRMQGGQNFVVLDRLVST